MTPTLPSPTPISPTELLTRYVLDRGHLKENDSHVHWRAFRPRPVETELSIARIHDLIETGIWELGDHMTARPNSRRVLGRADFTPSAVATARNASAPLDVRADEPPRRHALIVGWPVGNEEARKAAAIVLRAESTQVIRPPTAPATTGTI